MLSDDRYEWSTVSTPNLRIHFPVGSHADATQSILLEQAEASRESVLHRLSETDDGQTFDVFYVDSRTDMENLTGNPVTGYSYFNDNAVVVVFNEEWRAFERHELAHTVTLGRWSEPSGIAVVEGVATFVEGICGGYENAEVLRTVLETEELIPLGTLEDDFRRQNDLVGYLQAAGIIEFMVNRIGPGALRRLWDRGLLDSPPLLEMSINQFQAAFQEWLLSAYDPIPLEAWEAITRGGCGIDARPADGSSVESASPGLPDVNRHPVLQQNPNP
jgi:hypothetical protein